MNEIGLQDLIYQVKRELLAPNPAQRAKDPYPLFSIDKIELEVSVNISRVDSSGVRFTILDFLETSTSHSAELRRGHVVRVSLSPLLPREEMLLEVRGDTKLNKALIEQSGALLKGETETVKGEPE